MYHITTYNMGKMKYQQPYSIDRNYALNEALREREVLREHRRQKYEARSEIKFISRRQMLG